MTDAGENRREQMLRAALEVIVERGYADTRIADVAERTGTSPALVIYYFKTRDQLLTEAIRYSEDSWYAEGQRRMGEIPTAAGRLAELVAMTCLPGTDPEPRSWWLLWLGLWGGSAGHPGVGGVGAVAADPGCGRGAAEVRRAVAGDHPFHRAGRPGGRGVRAGGRGRLRDHAVGPARSEERRVG